MPAWTQRCRAKMCQLFCWPLITFAVRYGRRRSKRSCNAQMAGTQPDHDPTFGGILIIVALVIGLLSRNILTKLPVLRKVPYTVRFVVAGLIPYVGCHQ